MLENIDDPTIIKTKVRPFITRGNQGNIQIKDEFEGPIQFSLDNADLQLEQPFFLKSHGAQQLLLRIRVPEGAPEGDYYYTLLNETQPPPALEGAASSRAQATIGANILVTVTSSGNVDLKGKISIFDVLSNRTISLFGRKINLFDSSDIIPINLQVENKGKNMVKPSGQIILRGNFGEEAKYQIWPQNILSESQRLLTATPSASINCNEGKNKKICSSPYSLLLSGFFVGNYKLSTTINFGEGSPNLYASASFIALPYKFIFILLLTIIVSVGIVIKLKSSHDDD